MRKMILGGTAGIAMLVSLPALALTSKYSATSTMSPDDLWAKVGDFCGIGQWHPAIAKCALSDNGMTRTLDLKGGGTIVEKLLKRDDAKHMYKYAIVSGPLPVEDYNSTIKVVAAKDGTGSKLVWSGNYKAKGASDADAKKAIDGVYKSGVDALVAQ